MEDSNLNIVKVLDSRLNTSGAQTFALIEGCSQATARSYPSSSF